MAKNSQFKVALRNAKAKQMRHCGNKVKFRSPEGASVLLGKIPSMTAYLCIYCNFYHIGH